MKSKAPLTMMEQMVMLLVFALASALCLQAFVRSDAISKQSEIRDRAYVAAQSALEAVRFTKGDMEAAAALLGAGNYEQDSLMIDYTQDWEVGSPCRFTLGICRKDSGVAGLGMAQVWIRDEWDESKGGGELVRMDVAWQEVTP